MTNVYSDMHMTEALTIRYSGTHFADKSRVETGLQKVGFGLELIATSFDIIKIYCVNSFGRSVTFLEHDKHKITSGNQRNKGLDLLTICLNSPNFKKKVQKRNNELNFTTYFLHIATAVADFKCHAIGFLQWWGYSQFEHIIK